MKKVILLFITLISYSTYSQFNNMNQGNRQNLRQRQMPQTPRQAPEFKYEVEKYLGIVVYDIERAAKKSKIKRTSDTGKAFSKTLTAYNREIKDLRRINSFTLRSTREMVENFQRNAQKTGDASGQKKVQETMAENLKPISEVLKTKDLELDKKMKTILSKKQYEKWINYNRKLFKVFPTEVTE
ncbi:hypothetical protein K8354_15575 [Polaribacter litorisediminis]|uniref:hypothetical protein n=1 Tax=Polaribacter litorisediminis TaxID=1908341 RepID=UPI001CBC9EFC|nr:hypothetical protein [Polaribacter litorisediminis]UAM97698.1 hypothetical protein K8354_15575 [Polaribacter litorisediminis]